MYNGRKISIVIPCYNEEEGIAKVINRIPEFVDEIIVVDNHSTDNTKYVAESLGAKVVFEEIRGYGRAYKTGFKNVSGDIIVTLDGDGSYPVEELPKLLDFMAERNLDFVSGKRFPLMDKSSMEVGNIVGNKVVTLIANLLFVTNFKDVLSGMWAFKRSVLPKMQLISDNWDFSEEIKIEAILNENIKFGEFHISYYKRTGKSKLSLWKVGIGNILFLFKKRFLRRWRKDSGSLTILGKEDLTR
ncbi:MAG: glycosyltransferase family 2 protein [Candidatus Hydrothermarchaeota archaeon]|nr:MAG: glycosyltransferase family 2 protein [Candidatus Hydrothermarchaeota archaeon]